VTQGRRNRFMCNGTRRGAVGSAEGRLNRRRAAPVADRVVCLLVSAMASLDVIIVAVAERTVVAEFHSTQAVVGGTVAAYILGWPP